MIQRALTILISLALAAPALAQEAEHGGGGENNIFAGDVGNMIWTLVIFLLVVLVLGKFAWGPILNTLQARESFIHEALATAKRDRDAAEARLREYEEKLAQSRAEATAIVDEGRRDAVVVKQRIEEDAQREADKRLERAKREIQIATETATKELYLLSARLATDMAGKMIGRELTPQDHERLIAESLDGVNAAAIPPRV
ncbi:MAG: F-type H+-transporting ATPase subunit b [Acidobacteriota bacterium]|jgi:F-type H+-transporting ATPase subunit b|nr:F-type H+-transporting ATPase subunit b [Acidobacteriota bacterium]